MTHTHTFATLPVTESTYEEIKGKLTTACYEHAFQETDKGTVIDMHGIALLKCREVGITSSLEIRAARLLGSARALARRAQKLLRILEYREAEALTVLPNDSVAEEIKNLCAELLEDPWPSPERDWDEEILEFSAPDA